jgi:hypothetical protein
MGLNGTPPSGVAVHGLIWIRRLSRATLSTGPTIHPKLKEPSAMAGDLALNLEIGPMKSASFNRDVTRRAALTKEHDAMINEVARMANDFQKQVPSMKRSEALRIAESAFASRKEA